jgi:hypothetical protein
MYHDRRQVDRGGSGSWLGTYRGNSTRSRDCAHRPGGLSESVSEHGDHSLWAKEKIKNQLQRQLMEKRCGTGCGGIETFTLE